MPMMQTNSKPQAKGAPPGRTGSRPLFQTAWVVDDLDSAVRHWATLGVGPFLVFRNVVINFRHRGKPATAEVSFALAQAGPSQIELIAQHDARPSAYRDMYQRGESGLHHVGCLVQDYDSAVGTYTSQGIELATEGVTGDVRYAYLDTRHLIGCMTEIVGNVPSVASLYESVRIAGQDWDGHEPIREMTLTDHLK
jgi:methylmalonyl-CoA/ethylmalonyl-CoA epimerase